MAAEPFISVIMPVYNNETYLPIAAKSVLGQGVAQLELIIIDDGSTDRTPVVADQIAASDSRVSVLHQKNQWIYASFNHGIAAARGKYIYILNSDDTLRQGALPLLCHWAQRYQPDVVWTKVLPHLCDSRQRILKYDIYGYGRLVEEDRYYADEQAVRENWLYFYRSKLAFNQANLYRRQIAAAHPFRNDVYGADQFFNLSIAPDVKSAVVLREPVYDHFLYEAEGMNVSKGNYFGYEHRMFNELYEAYTALFRSWGLLGQEASDVFAAMRLNNLTNEIRSLSAKRCPLGLEQKLEKVFSESIDETVYQCAASTGRMEELNSRVLSGCRELLCAGAGQNLGQYQFVYDYLDSMLRYEKTETDWEKIKRAVFHKRNPYRIGKNFYDKLLAAGHVQ